VVSPWAPHGRHKRSEYSYLGSLYLSKYAAQPCNQRRETSTRESAMLGCADSYVFFVFKDEVRTFRNPELCAKHPVLKFMVSESCIFRRPVR